MQTMKADLILIGDLHLREDRPKARIDDYWAAQERKVKWLRELAEEYACYVIDSGDLFNTWKPSPRLLAWAIKNGIYRIDEPGMYSVPGNHDIPRHNLDLLHKSGFAVMEAAGAIERLDANAEYLPTRPPYNGGIWVYGKAWGENNDLPASRQKLIGGEGTTDKKDRHVAVIHEGVYVGKTPWPGAEKTMKTTKNIASRFKDFDLVVTGHYHEPFVEKIGKTLIVNPGSMMRMTANQENHRPRAYLWDAEKNEVEPAYFPMDEKVINREHIEIAKERDERLVAFAERVNEDFSTSLSFTGNLENYFDENRTRREIKDKVWEFMG